mmetsp:Transcript_106149/g.297148  ORF Transcript_106149/g.297148 Transcript_106149/m.297148 type:complete len:207 (+) Transcript_106149:305-925(+)
MPARSLWMPLSCSDRKALFSVMSKCSRTMPRTISRPSAEWSKYLSPSFAISCATWSRPEPSPSCSISCSPPASATAGGLKYCSTAVMVGNSPKLSHAPMRPIMNTWFDGPVGRPSSISGAWRKAEVSKPNAWESPKSSQPNTWSRSTHDLPRAEIRGRPLSTKMLRSSRPPCTTPASSRSLAPRSNETTTKRSVLAGAYVEPGAGE